MRRLERLVDRLRVLLVWRRLVAHGPDHERRHVDLGDAVGAVEIEACGGDEERGANARVVVAVLALAEHRQHGAAPIVGRLCALFALTLDVELRARHPERGGAAERVPCDGDVAVVDQAFEHERLAPRALAERVEHPRQVERSIERALRALRVIDAPDVVAHGVPAVIRSSHDVAVAGEHLGQARVCVAARAGAVAEEHDRARAVLTPRRRRRGARPRSSVGAPPSCPSRRPSRPRGPSSSVAPRGTRPRP